MPAEGLQKTPTRTPLQIAHFKIPKYILFKEKHEFPMTVTGKIKKFEMKEVSKWELELHNVQSHFTQLGQ